jgi:tryptophan 2,3-dioxygenase
LREAALKHYIFGELAELTSFLVQRAHLPQLPEALEKKLGFSL